MHQRSINVQLFPVRLKDKHFDGATGSALLPCVRGPRTTEVLDCVSAHSKIRGAIFFKYLELHGEWEPDTSPSSHSL